MYLDKLVYVYMCVHMGYMEKRLPIHSCPMSSGERLYQNDGCCSSGVHFKVTGQRNRNAKEVTDFQEEMVTNELKMNTLKNKSLKQA